MNNLTLLKSFLAAFLSFFFGLVLTPFLIKIFYKYKLWKQVSRKIQTEKDTLSDAYKAIHHDEVELSTPRVGGLVVWLPVTITIILLFILSQFFPSPLLLKLDFLSRNQTFLPLIALVLGGILGFFEDFLEILGSRTKYVHGLPKGMRVLIIATIGLIFALWFFIKLDVSQLYIPFIGFIELGFLFIPYFVLVTLGIFSSRVIDGVDGLSGGVLATIFAGYGIIAMIQNQNDLAAFCGVIIGALLVFLWFNIPPAKFWMGETGMLALSFALTMVIFLTGQSLLILVIGLPLVATSLSSFLQIISKKYFNKKIFKVAPLHHHFQALGWKSEQVTMRYWVVSVICAFVGVMIFIVG